jgi:hypothetical protein
MKAALEGSAVKEIPEIVLPAGKRTVVVSDIPRLIALALYPKRPESPYILKCITKHFGPNPARRSLPCGSDELRLVAEIAGPLPLMGQPIVKEELDGYLTRFNTSPNRPEWVIGASVDNETLNADMNRMNAEDDHRAALRRAIRAGSFVPLSHALLPLDETIREALDLGQVFVKTFREYAKTFEVLVRIKGVVIQDLAESISQESADRHPEKWNDPTDLDPLRRTIVAAINKHGWPPDGIPGVLPFIYAEIEVGNIGANSVFNDIPCTDISLVQANPAQWYVTENAARYLLKAMLGFVDGTHGLHENIDDSEILVMHQFKSILYNNSDEPIWEEWAEYPKLTARQAVPLIHGLNPKFFAAESTALPPGRAHHMSRAQEYFRVCSHRLGVAQAEELDKLTPAEWFSWADKKRWLVCADFRRLAQPKESIPALKAEVTSEPAWKETARRIAREYLEKNWANDLHPAQDDVSRHVADKMRNSMNYGPHGRPLAANYIKRNAIQGEWWRNVHNSREKREI